jgi:hypothetical protein
MALIWFYVKETNYFLEDTVIVPYKFEKKLLEEGVVGEEKLEGERRKEEVAKREAGEKGGVVTVNEVQWSN